MSSTTITAKVAEPGIHYWPDAPKSRGYLAEPHRHLFVARATVAVDHHDRAVEFHDLGDDLHSALAGQTGRLVMGRHGTSLHDFGAQSCEMLATGIAGVLLGHGYSVVSVSVSEDDEFTATVFPSKTKAHEVSS